MKRDLDDARVEQEEGCESFLRALRMKLVGEVEPKQVCGASNTTLERLERVSLRPLHIVTRGKHWRGSDPPLGTGFKRLRYANNFTLEGCISWTDRSCEEDTPGIPMASREEG